MNYDKIPELKYTAGNKYQLDRTISCMSGILGYAFKNRYYQIQPDGKLTAFKGCAWNGANNKYDGESWMTSSLFHDIGCWLIASGELPTKCQKQVDIMLRDIAIAKGSWRWYARTVYKMVRFHFRDGRKPDKRKILTAP